MSTKKIMMKEKSSPEMIRVLHEVELNSDD